MTEDINRSYVQHYFDQALSTDDEDLQDNALYRVGTQMEIIPCNGHGKLTPQQRQKILSAADEFLGGQEGEE